jgi:exosortase A-associated hydrolase 2
MTVGSPRVAGTFIEGPACPLAAMVWEPPPGEPVRFGVLHVPPAGDELNKSRRMIAMQARAFAGCGGLVAVVDLRGTGDSAGEHGEASWSGWRADIEAAWAWLATLARDSPLVLWGLRLGGLLAADCVASRRIAPGALLLWQPVVAGRAFFNQWLRVASAQQLVAGDRASVDANALRKRLAAGFPVEVAGYNLHPDLVSGADAADLAKLPPPACPVVWRETTIATPPELSPAAARVKSAWSASAVRADFRGVAGASFWASQELAEAPQLITATTQALIDSLAGVEAVGRC